MNKTKPEKCHRGDSSVSHVTSPAMSNTLAQADLEALLAELHLSPYAARLAQAGPGRSVFSPFWNHKYWQIAAVECGSGKHFGRAGAVAAATFWPGKVCYVDCWGIQSVPWCLSKAPPLCCDCGCDCDVEQTFFTAVPCLGYNSLQALSLANKEDLLRLGVLEPQAVLSRSFYKGPVQKLIVSASFQIVWGHVSMLLTIHFRRLRPWV